MLAEVQSMSAEELDLKPISAEINIPREEIDPYIESFAQLDGWPAGTGELRRRRPTGQGRASRASGRRRGDLAPHPCQVIGPESSLVFGAETPEEHERVEASKKEAMQIRIWDQFAAEIDNNETR
jgi:hypothetical protein